MKKNQHVVPYKKNGKTVWAVKTAGAKRNTRILPTQKAAEKLAKSIAKNNKSELFIHKRDGTIRERNSYGKDNFPPKG